MPSLDTAKGAEPKKTASRLEAGARTARNVGTAASAISKAAEQKKRDNSKASNRPTSAARKPLASARPSTASTQADSKSGLKRPTGAFGAKQSVSGAAAKAADSRPSTGIGGGGLKRPTDVKSSAASAAQSKKEAASSVSSPSKVARSSMNATGPVSAAKDETDAIYNNADPIDVSLSKRLNDGGSKIAQVPDKNNKQGKYFFTLKQKGDVPISDQAKKNVAKLDNKVVDAASG